MPNDPSWLVELLSGYACSLTGQLISRSSCGCFTASVHRDQTRQKTRLVREHAPSSSGRILTENPAIVSE